MRVHGQGRPRPNHRASIPTSTHSGSARRCAPSWMGHRSHRLPLHVLALCGLVTALLAGLVRAEEAHTPESFSLRLHIAWGGGEARRWNGTIETVGGTLSELERLGLHADEAAAIAQDTPERILIRPAVPRTYEGVQFSVTGRPDTLIRVTLTSDREPQHVRTLEIRLSDLQSGYRGESLDKTGNRILIRRAPGDTLRLELDRETLIFDTGETWELPIRPYAITADEGLPLQLAVELHRARSDQALWSESQSVHLDTRGIATSVTPFRIPLPSDEGVYELHIRLKPARLRDTLVRSKPLAERKVQFVVLKPTAQRATAEGKDSPSATPDFDAVWKPVESWHPTRTNWTDWLSQIPTVPWLMPSFARKPLGNDRASVRDSAGGTWTELSPGGWQALPLPVDRVGRPHILEVEFPQDLVQSLGIRIVEPDAAGRVMNTGLDSGIQVPWEATLEGARRNVHRLVFWPKSRNPLVVLVNHDPHRIARFGQIRVLAGPDHLPAVPRGRIPEKPRLAAAYFHKPFWPAVFSATQQLDPATGRSLDDWQTFYEAGTRLVEYLRHTGYNGAVVCVASEGSTLYPSRYLEPTPKFDSGIYFTDGRDPRRKDVVELLMRLFERESLTLIPAIELSGALPEIEALRRRGVATGILLNDGRRVWPGFHGSWKEQMPPYNPLDDRVQEAIEHVFRELAERYDGHASFGGVAWLAGGRGIGLFPDAAWGRDAVTWQKFQAQWSQDHAEADNLPRTSETDWLQWRSRELLSLHRRLQRVIARNARNARLWLLTPDLFAEDAVRQALRPDLLRTTDFRQQLLRFGLEPERYRNEEKIVLVQSRRVPPPFTPAQFSLAYQQRTPAWQTLFQGYQASGLLFFHEPIWRALPGFDRQSPFGKESTQLTVLSHLVPPGRFARARFVEALAEQDVHFLLDGGWELAMGGEEALRRFWHVWRQLPAESFRTVPASSDGATRAATVLRVAQRADDTYLYLAHAAPWPATVTVQLQFPPTASVETLGDHTLPEANGSGNTRVWKVELEPFDLAALRIDSGSVRVVSWKTETPPDWGSRVAEAIRTLRAQANRLRAPEPMTVLANASFEQDGTEIPGWIVARGPGIRIRTDDTVSYDGKRSLHIRSSGNIAWVRSQSLPAPTTGRVFVVARLRTSDPAKQPPLRIAIDGRRNGVPYYRSARVGAGDAKTPKIAADWGNQPFLLPITDLPTGGWQDFRIGFDLMGEGEVWIDDVKIYDVYFLVKERQELMLRIAVHESLAARGRWSDCYHFLTGYWPQLLLSQLDAPPALVAHRTDPVAPQPAPKDPKPPEPKSSPSILERIKPKWPTRWNPF